MNNYYSKTHLEDIVWATFRHYLVSTLPAIPPHPIQLAVGKTVSAVTSQLRRHLDLWDLCMLGIGATIGAGIFVLTGLVATEIGPAAVLSFFLAGVACMIDALAYAELSARFPVSGAAYTFAYTVLGELPAVLVGANLMLEYSFGAAAISHGLVGYTIKFFSGIGLNIPSQMVEVDTGLVTLHPLSALVIVILTLFLLRGVKESARFNSIVTLLSIGVIFLIIGFGLWKVDTDNWTPFFPKGASPVLWGAATVFFSYIGFDVLSNCGEEAINPRRNLPIAIVLSLLVCIGLYGGVTIVVTGLIPYSEIDKDAPLSSGFSSVGLGFLPPFIDAGAALGLVTSLFVGLFSQPRIYFAMASDGLLPSFFAKTSQRFSTPLYAQVYCGTVAAILALFLDLEGIASTLGIGLISSYIVVCVAIISLRFRKEESVEKDVENDALINSVLDDQVSNASNKKPASHSFAMFLVVLFIAACLAAGFGLQYDFRWYEAASLATVLMLASWLLPQISEAVSPAFICPMVPILPLFGIAIHCVLLSQMRALAWLRLGVWSLVVLLFWVAFGRRTAVLGHRSA